MFSRAQMLSSRNVMRMFSTDTKSVKVKRALLSVSDKTNIEALGSFLVNQGVQLLSTGGTAQALRDANLPVTDVAEYTQMPEMMGGRVKSLHPKIHGALLGRRDLPDHVAAMEEHDITPIDLVVANLYPFEKVLQQPDASYSQLVENIDIGGPSMLRSAAKNHDFVTVCSDPSQYDALMTEMDASGGATSLALRQRLAQNAFALTSQYDSMISTWLASQLPEPEVQAEQKLNEAPQNLTREYNRSFNMKYGCNPHQAPAAMYALGKDARLPFTVLNGNPGYINMLDAGNAYQLVAELKIATGLAAAASFKHVSPAGAGLGVPLTPLLHEVYEVPEAKELTPLALAYLRARQADPMCSFGDFVGLSDVVDEATAKVLKSEVSDGVVAPGYTPEALEILKKKKGGNFCILEVDPDFEPPSEEFREVFGMGFMQQRNALKLTQEHVSNLITGEELSTEAKNDLLLAMVALKYTQSNSVGYALGGQMIGIGAGQQSRVDCVKLAGRKAATWWLRQHPKVLGLQFKKGVKKVQRVNARVQYIEGDLTPAETENLAALFEIAPEPLTLSEKEEFLAGVNGVSLASDAFFPFRDSIDYAAKVGVKYITQPGGSVRDEEVVGACEEFGMSMVYSGVRAFHH